MSKEALHQPEAARLVPEGDGGGAAQIVRDDSLVNSQVLTELVEFAAKGSHAHGVITNACDLRAVPLHDLSDKRCRAVEVTGLEDFADRICHRQCPVRSFLGFEMEDASLRVVIVRADFHGGSAADA